VSTAWCIFCSKALSFREDIVTLRFRLQEYLPTTDAARSQFDLIKDMCDYGDSSDSNYRGCQGRNCSKVLMKGSRQAGGCQPGPSHADRNRVQLERFSSPPPLRPSPPFTTSLEISVSTLRSLALDLDSLSFSSELCWYFD
jgi:hypothetical protein